MFDNMPLKVESTSICCPNCSQHGANEDIAQRDMMRSSYMHAMAQVLDRKIRWSLLSGQVSSCLVELRVDIQQLPMLYIAVSMLVRFATSSCGKRR